MNFLQRFKNRKVQGAELVVTGGIMMIFSKIIMVYLAPLAVIGYGAYRWLIKKNYRQGITSIAAGIILLVLMKWPLSFLASLPLGIGALILVYGAFLMIMPGSPTEDIEQSRKIID